MRASRSFALALAVSVCSAGTVGLAQETRDIEAMIQQLEGPKVGSYTVGSSFSFEGLTSKLAPEQPGEDVDSLLARGNLSGADWKHIAEVSYDKGEVRFANLAAGRAIEAYSQQVTKTPDDVDALVALGTLLAFRGREAEAGPHLRKALEIDPARFDAYVPMSQVFLVQSYPVLRTWGDACATEFARAFPEQCEQMGYSADNLPPLHVALEWLCVVKPSGEMLAKIVAAGRLVVGTLDQLTPFPQTLYGQWYSTAMGRIIAELSADRPAEAIVAALAMMCGADGRAVFYLARQPANDPPPSLDELCGFMILSGLTPEFIDACQRACIAHPDELEIRGLVGALQAMEVMRGLSGAPVPGVAPPATDSAQVDRAIANLRAAMGLPAERRAGVTGNLAAMYLLRGDTTAACGVAENAIARGEWDWPTVSAALMGLSGLDLRQAMRDPTIVDAVVPERVREVESTLAKWIASAPPSDDIPHGTLAAARRRLGDFAGAAEALRKAREFAPQSQLYACGLGVALLKGGQRDQAVEVLAEAAALPPGSDDLARLTHKAYGTALLAVGRQAEGEAELKLAEGQ